MNRLARATLVLDQITDTPFFEPLPVGLAGIAEVEINLVWRSLPKEKRQELLEAQRAFNLEKEAACEQADKEAGGGGAGLIKTT